MTSFHEKCILLLEGDREVRKQLEGQLANLGLIVLSAATLTQAVRLHEEHHLIIDCIAVSSETIHHGLDQFQGFSRALIFKKQMLSSDLKRHLEQLFA